jgi:hypothetical protein
MIICAVAYESMLRFRITYTRWYQTTKMAFMISIWKNSVRCKIEGPTLDMSSVPDGIPVGTITANLAFGVDTRALRLAFIRGSDDSCQVDVCFIGTVFLRLQLQRLRAGMISDATTQQRTRLQSQNPLTYHAITQPLLQQPPELL